MKGIKLNRIVQFKRADRVKGGGGGHVLRNWADLGHPVFADRKDVSDQERLVTTHFENKLVVRFIIRSSGFARGLKWSDMIAHEGAPFNINGIRELPGNAAFLEITAVTSEALTRQPPFEV